MNDDDPNDAIDMHELRMGMGQASMAVSDALDEDVLRLVSEASEPAMKAYRRLRDNGIDHTPAMHMMLGFLLAALDRERRRYAFRYT